MGVKVRLRGMFARLGSLPGLRRLRRRQRGSTLVEVLIAIVVLAMLLASVPPVLLMTVHAEFTRNEQRIAESLTRMQMEYVKSAGYISGNVSVPYPAYTVVPVPNDSYEIRLTAQPIGMDYDELPAGQDDGLQEITVQVYHVDKMVLETRNYKVNR